MQIAGQRRHRAVDLHLLVHKGVAAPAGPTAVEQPQVVVGIPVAVQDPPVDEPHLAREARPGKALMVGAPEKFLDAGPQRGRHLLVGVERERPRPGGVIERPVLRVAVAAPLGLKHDGAMLLGDHFAVVGRPVQHDDDLRDPALHTREAARQVGRLIAGDDDDGEGEGFSHGWCRWAQIKAGGNPTARSLVQRRDPVIPIGDHPALVTAGRLHLNHRRR